MNLEQVKEYIESEGLNGKSREHFYVFRRHYLCWALYQTNQLTLSQIGRIFNRNHATVIHSIRKHEELKNDRLYQKMIESCVELMIGHLTVTRQKRDIFEDMEKATNYEKLKRVRRWLIEGRYDYQINSITDVVYEKIKDNFPQDEQN